MYNILIQYYYIGLMRHHSLVWTTRTNSELRNRYTVYAYWIAEFCKFLKELDHQI